jgi:hypothetical protein
VMRVLIITVSLALLAISAQSAAGVPPEFALNYTLYREHVKGDDCKSIVSR